MTNKHKQKNRERHEEQLVKSAELYRTGSACQHFLDSINLNRLRKEVMTRKLDCSECFKSENAVKDNDNLSDKSFEMWICLQCGSRVCKSSKRNHVVSHFQISKSFEHCVMMNTLDCTIWCYNCDKKVSNSNTIHKNIINEITKLLNNTIKSMEPKPSMPLCQIEKPSALIEKKTPINEFPKVGGLVNLGNTCFFNAVLQCLAQTPYLIKVLDDLQVSGQKTVIPGGLFKGANEEVDLPPIEGVLQKSGIITPILHKTLTEMQNSKGQVYKPSELLNSLRQSTNQYTDGGQHDSHELLRHLLDEVRSEDFRRYKTIILHELGLNEKSKRQNADSSLIDHLKFYGNQASAKLLGPERVFRGELFSTLQCLKCRHYSSRAEPFLDLSLPVSVEKSLSPSLARKNCEFDKSLGSITTSSKSSMKKLNKNHKASSNKKSRGKRAKIHDTHTLSASNQDLVSDEKKESPESEGSATDVEDNTENEEIVTPEVGESGYSSEKPSALTSPESVAEFRYSDRSTDNLEAHLSPTVSSTACGLDVVERSPYNNCSASGRAYGQMITNLSETKNIKMAYFSAMTSLDYPDAPDAPEPEGPTTSPPSTPFTSKHASATSVSSDEERVLDKVEGSVLTDGNVKEELSDKESACSATQIKSIDFEADKEDEENSVDKESCAATKLTNGICDITSGIVNIDLSNYPELEAPYPTKRGECSIQLCLNQFTKYELMSGNNKVGCVACTKRENKGEKEGVKMVCTDSIKKYFISQVPAVLILHLKRFQMQRFSFCKVLKPVNFPILLDLAPISKDFNKPKIYALYGVVEHTGNLCGGHYVAYIKSRAPLKPTDPRWSFLPSKDNFPSEESSPSDSNNPDLKGDEITEPKATGIEAPQGQWYCASDSRVYEVDEESVLRKNAYLLFYERIL